MSTTDASGLVSPFVAWFVREVARLEVSRPWLARMLRWLWSHPQAVLLPLAAVVGAFAGLLRQDGDQVRFRAAGVAMLGPGMLNTFSDSWLQVGPLYLAALGAWSRLWQAVGLSSAAIGMSSAALQCVIIAWLTLFTARRAAHALAPRQTEWVVGSVLVLGGFLNQAMFADHPEEPLLGVLTALAAVEVQRGRRIAAAVLLGLGSGIKTWAPLAAGVLLHGRRWRPALAAGALLALLVAVQYGPFVVWGRVSSFDLTWAVPRGSWYSTLAGTTLHIGWAFRLVQALLAGGAGLLVAGRRRGSALAAAVVSVAVRLLVDPLRLSYYWTALVAVLLFWLWTTPTPLGRRLRVPVSLALPFLAWSQPLLPTPTWWFVGSLVCLAVPVLCLVAERSAAAPRLATNASQHASAASSGDSPNSRSIAPRSPVGVSRSSQDAPRV